MRRLRNFTRWLVHGNPKQAKHRGRERASWSTYLDIMWEGYTNTRHRLSQTSGIAVEIIVAELQRERRGFTTSIVGASA